MISVLYTHFEKPFSPNTWNKYLTQLPSNFHDRINRFVRWQDRHANLLDKLLLIEGLKRYGLPREKLNDIKYNRYKRPYFEGGFDFNISHSGEYVICALSDEGTIGIDLERIRDIKINEFKSFFSASQWELLSKDFSLQGFFRLWTKLESVIKWDGSGLYVDMNKVQLMNDRAEVNGKTCFLHKVSIDREYPCYFSTNNFVNNFILKKIEFGEP